MSRISPQERARLEYRSRAIDRLVDALYGRPEDENDWKTVDRVLAPFRVERERRIAHAKLSADFTALTKETKAP